MNAPRISFVLFSSYIYFSCLGLVEIIKSSNYRVEKCLPVDFLKKKRPSMTKQKDNLTRDLFRISSLISILLCYIKQVLE